MTPDHNLRLSIRKLSGKYRSRLFRRFQYWIKHSPRALTMTASELEAVRLEMKNEMWRKLQKEKAELRRECIPFRVVVLMEVALMRKAPCGDIEEQSLSLSRHSSNLQEPQTTSHWRPHIFLRDCQGFETSWRKAMEQELACIMVDTENKEDSQ